ncbi:hypothetical protein ACHAWO_000634 [Cyclotella atomus]|jgi:hypothetical protein|uniref:Uncharacterized protein n=1 Tax=Cyclotella atomus TaxID=382360 RepID=A0ABD3PMI5_9STRA
MEATQLNRSDVADCVLSDALWFMQPNIIVHDDIGLVADMATVTICNVSPNHANISHSSTEELTTAAFAENVTIYSKTSQMYPS